MNAYYRKTMKRNFLGISTTGQKPAIRVDIGK
jgi:hypothetical protein